MEAQSATITNQDARQAGPVSQRGISLSRGGSGRLLLQLYSCCPRLVQLASQIRPCCLQVKQGPNRSTFVSSLPSLPPPAPSWKLMDVSGRSLSPAALQLMIRLQAPCIVGAPLGLVACAMMEAS